MMVTAIVEALLVLGILVLACMYTVERIAADELREHARIHRGDVETLIKAHAKTTADMRAAVVVAEERAASARARLQEMLTAELAPFRAAEPKLRGVEDALGPDGKAAIRVRLSLASAADDAPEPGDAA
jgi:hypothetical protein